MEPTTPRSRRHAYRPFVLVAAACLGALAVRGDMRADDPPPPPVLNGSVKADGSTPPVGAYPNPGRPEYDPHPTAYIVSPPLNTEWALPLGNPIPKTGSSNFSGTTFESDQPILFTVHSQLPAARTLHGNPAGHHRMEPYFAADKEISCHSPACGGSLDTTLYAKWGNVKGTVTLIDGTPPPFPLVVTAKPDAPVPPDAGSAFHPRSVSVSRTNGEFSFAGDFLFQDNPAAWQCVPPFQYVCATVPFDIENNWGLRVVGDGGVRDRSPLLYSNRIGSFPWSIVLSSKRKTTVEVQSSRASTVAFFLTLEEVFETFQEQMENRPSEDDSPEADDPCGGGGGDGTGLGAGGPEGAPHPVSLLTGNVYLDQTDARLRGVRHDVLFGRSYNSASQRAGSLGRGWTHSFEKQIEVISPQILRLWGDNGVPSYFTDPDENGSFTPYGAFHPASTITKNADGTFLRVFRTGGWEEYRSDGHLAKRADRVGRTTVLTYTPGGQLTEILTPEGRKLRFERPFGRLQRIVGAEGTIAEYSYNIQGLLWQVRYSDGTGYRYTYDSGFRLTTVSDRAGVVLDRHGYVGNKAAWSELNGGRERRSYTYEADRTLVTDARGAISTFGFTQERARRFVSSVTGCGFCGPTGGTQIWEYDDEGRVTRYVDADDNPTVYTWEGANLTQVTNALGLTTVYGGHDEFGRPGTVTRPGFGMTTIAYAPEGVTEVRLPTGQATKLTYDNHRLKSVRTAAGTTLAFDINERGELRSFTDGRGKTTTYTHDAMGRIGSFTTAEGLTTHFERSGGDRVSSVQRPDGKRTRFEYDVSGRFVGTIDEAGHRSRYAYDAYDRIETYIDPLGGVTRLGYDVMSNLTSLTDAKRQKTTFEYDYFGRPETMIDPMGGKERLEYYPSGRIKTWTDRKGVRTTYTYDGLGRLRSRTHSDGTPTLTVDYDDLARTMRLSNAVDTVELSFDPARRLRSEKSVLNGTTVTYTYTDEDLVETVSLNSDLLARYGYEAMYLRTIDFAGRRFELTYDDVGRRKELKHPNGLETHYEYDPTLGWLRGIRTGPPAGTSLWEIAYTHDDVGNRRSRSEAARVDGYAYDAASRVVAVDRTGASPQEWRFTYDAVGNRLRERRGGLVRDFRHDARNRLLDEGSSGNLRVSGTTSEPATVTVEGEAARMLPGNVFETDVPSSGGETEFSVEARDASGNTRTNTYRVPAAGPATYAHDANGNLIERTGEGESWGYEWDAVGQLTRVTRDGQEIARFAYDPLGRRVRKVAGGTAYRWVYGGFDILQETVSAGAASDTYRYLHGPGFDEPLARQHTATAAVEYYHADELGSIVGTTNESGSVASTKRYDAWGNLEEGADQPGYAFTGREWDPETRLYYYRARHYDPKLGRFISEDPIGFDGGFNFYEYVANSPLNGTDPTGLLLDSQSATKLTSAWAAALAEPSPVGEIVMTVVTVGVFAYEGYELYCAHKKNARPSTREDHEEAEARRQRETDPDHPSRKHYPPRRRPDGHKGPWPPRPTPTPSPSPSPTPGS